MFGLWNLWGKMQIWIETPSTGVLSSIKNTDTLFLCLKTVWKLFDYNNSGNYICIDPSSFLSLFFFFLAVAVVANVMDLLVSKLVAADNELAW